MDKVLLWLQEKIMDSIPKPMEVQVLENLPEQEDFYHTLRYFGVLLVSRVFFSPIYPIATTCVMKTKDYLTLKAGLSEEKLSPMPCLRTFSNVLF